MNLKIQPAQRRQKKAKIALIGPSGSGKTMSALRLAAGLANGGRILLLDTERSSATLYAETVAFDHADMPDCEYQTFLEAIDVAARARYDVLIIDSASHAWEKFLEAHEMEAQRTRNSFTAWAKITPQYNQLINAIISYPGHCIVTMRAKTEYVIEKNDKGKEAPRKVGLAAVMRPGVEYEFDVVGLIDIEHNMIVEKTRFDWLADKIVKKPDQKLGQRLREWLDGGAPVPVATPAAGTNPETKQPQQSAKPLTQQPQSAPANGTSGRTDLTPRSAGIDGSNARVDGEIPRVMPTNEHVEPDLSPDAYKLESKRHQNGSYWCQRHGQALGAIHREDPKWIPAILADPKKLTHLTDRAIANLQAFAAIMCPSALTPPTMILDAEPPTAQETTAAAIYGDDEPAWMADAAPPAEVMDEAGARAKLEAMKQARAK